MADIILPDNPIERTGLGVLKILHSAALKNSGELVSQILWQRAAGLKGVLGSGKLYLRNDENPNEGVYYENVFFSSKENVETALQQLQHEKISEM